MLSSPCYSPSSVSKVVSELTLTSLIPLPSKNISMCYVHVTIIYLVCIHVREGIALKKEKVKQDLHFILPDKIAKRAEGSGTKLYMFGHGHGSVSFWFNLV